MNRSANFFGDGQNWITKSLHQRSGSGVAVLGTVRPLMEDTLSKPSEHVRLCVEQIIVAYLIKPTATLTGLEVDVLQ